MKKARIPNFEGGSDPDIAEKWLKEVQNNFELIQIPEEMKAQVIKPFLTGEADEWWTTNLQHLPAPVTWERFLRDFRKFYIPPSVTLQKIGMFESLVQMPGMTVADYANRFTALGRYVPAIMGDEQPKMIKFERGLNPRIRTWIVNANPRDFGELLDACYRIERDIIRRDADTRGKRPQEFGDGQFGKGAKTARGDDGHNRQQNYQQQPQPQRQPQQQRPPQANPVPKCPKCQKQHTGACLLKIGACFNCGKIGHMIKDCPEPRKGPQRAAPQQRDGPRANARVHVMTDEEVLEAPDVVTGIFHFEKFMILSTCLGIACLNYELLQVLY